MTNQIITIGGSTWDVFLTTSQVELNTKNGLNYLSFPYGGKIDAEQVIYNFGGGAANVAVGLARLGFTANIISRVGADFRGQEVIKHLQSEGVGTTNLQTDKKLATALSFIVTGGGPHDHVAFVARGATTNLDIPSIINKNTTWLYITSLYSKDWSSKLQTLFANCKKQGQSIFWNPGQAQLLKPSLMKKLLPYVSILDVNKEEAEQLLNSKPDKPENLLPKLLKTGVHSALITDGANGAYYMNQTGIYHQPAFKVNPVNTTGAGDAFGSGFLAGFINSEGNTKTALYWGMLNATAVIMHNGAQKGLLTKSELLKLKS